VSLRDRLHDDLTAAMRSGDAFRRDTLRLAWNAVYGAEKRERRPLDDDEVAAVLAREVRTRRESAEAFRAGGREDLARPEEAAIEIVSGYLPRALSDGELHALVAEAIAATGASSPRDLGRVMGWLAPRTRGRADGRVVSGLVGTALAGTDVEGAGTSSPAARTSPATSRGRPDEPG
jgi:uncharacterized protein YqeY